MAEFNLAAMLSNVSNLDTAAREQIEYIAISNIEPDPKNFYSIEGIEELAASIELLGLQQPIRVRTSDNPDKVMVVSGHRRREALLLLVNEGKEQFASVPCIREQTAGSEALQELRLIYANSDTRTMTSAEHSQQAERVEALLYKLKEEGMEFPGRMRDHVAEACKISRSKLARLKVIREKLDKPFLQKFDRNEMGESVAYALARQPVEMQRQVSDLLTSDGESSIEDFPEWKINSTISRIEEKKGRECSRCEGGICEHYGVMLEKMFSAKGYSPCTYAHCCESCERFASCKTVCPHLKEKQAEVQKKAKEKRAEEKAAEKKRSDSEALLADEVRNFWVRFGKLRAEKKVSAEELYKAMDIHICSDLENDFKEKESGNTKYTKYTNLAFGYGIDISGVQKLINAADCLGCSIDEMLGHDTTRYKAILDSASAKAPLPSKPRWHTGDPNKSGDYTAKLMQEGLTFIKVVYYDSYMKKWYFNKDSSHALDMECIGWYPLPED